MPKIRVFRSRDLFYLLLVLAHSNSAILMSETLYYIQTFLVQVLYFLWTSRIAMWLKSRFVNERCKFQKKQQSSHAKICFVLKFGWFFGLNCSLLTMFPPLPPSPNTSERLTSSPTSQVAEPPPSLQRSLAAMSTVLRSYFAWVRCLSTPKESCVNSVVISFFFVNFIYHHLL